MGVDKVRATQQKAQREEEVIRDERDAEARDQLRTANLKAAQASAAFSEPAKPAPASTYETPTPVPSPTNALKAWWHSMVKKITGEK